MSSRIGVVVPCKNEAQTLARCLTSLRAQVPAIEQIIVVDNGSTDDSRRIAQQWADRVVDLPDVSISSLRNQGAGLLGSVDYVAFVDADCSVAPGWAAAALSGLERADMVGSRTFAPADAPWVAARWAEIERQRTRPEALLWSQHLVLRREAWEMLGGFDETLRTGEDADLSLRLRGQGGTVVQLDDMVAVHHGFPATLRRFVRRELWHTSSPGWFTRMSPMSRRLVLLTAGWTALGAGAAAAAVAGRSRPLATWLVGSTAALPLLGRASGGTTRHALQDGVLTAIWNFVRVGRLLGILAGRRSS